MSRRAILAPLIVRGMPCPARPPYMTYPLISCESLNERPCCLMMPTDLIGYDGLPDSGWVVLTMLMASTARLAKNSDCWPKIFDESVVFAMLKPTSRPSAAVLIAIWLLMNLID